MIGKGLAHTPRRMGLPSSFLWLVPIPLEVRKDGKRGRAKIVRGKGLAHTPTRMGLPSGFLWLVPIPLGVRNDGKRGRAKMMRGKDSPGVGKHTNND